MNEHRSTPPADAPVGTCWLGGPIGWFSVVLQVTEADLNPDLVSSAFNVRPTESCRKDTPILRPDGTVKRIPKFGSWSLEIKPGDAEVRDVERVVLDMLGQFPTALSSWRAVAKLGRMRLSLGLTLETKNQGISFQPDLLVFLGERGVRLDCDVYRHDF